MSIQHVIFGTGPLGKSVMRALLTRDNAYITMVNRSGKRGDIPVEVQVIATDAYDVDKVETVTHGADAVYQCAQPGYLDWQEQFPALQRAILEGTARNGAKLIVGDNLYMYGYVEGLIQEGLPYNATGKKGRVRAQMASEILEWHAQGKIRAALGRGSDFYGREVMGSALGDRVFPNLLQGKAPQFFGDVDLPHTYTYIDDFGEALAILGEHDDALGRAWHVPNAPTISTREVVEIIANEIGSEPKISVMPKLMVNVISLFHPYVRELKEMMYEFEHPYVVDDSDFRKTFGMEATPLEVGLRETIAWYRQHEAVTA